MISGTEKTRKFCLIRKQISLFKIINEFFVWNSSHCATLYVQALIIRLLMNYILPVAISRNISINIHYIMQHIYIYRNIYDIICDIIYMILTILLYAILYVFCMKTFFIWQLIKLK